MVRARGAFIYRLVNNKLEFLIIKHTLGGHWGFPKGRIEEGETDTEAAIREVYEEVGIKPQLFEGYSYRDLYVIMKKYQKEVIYYLAKAEKDMIVELDFEEISEYQWIDKDSVIKLIFHKSLIRNFKQAYDDILELEDMNEI